MSELLTSTEPYLTFREKLNLFNQFLRVTEVKNEITGGVETDKIYIDDHEFTYNNLKKGQKFTIINETTLTAFEIELSASYGDYAGRLDIVAQTFPETIAVGSKIYFKMISLLDLINNP